MTAPDPHAAAVRQARREAFEEAARVCDLWCEVNRELVWDTTWMGAAGGSIGVAQRQESRVSPGEHAAVAIAAKYMAETIRKMGEGA